MVEGIGRDLDVGQVTFEDFHPSSSVGLSQECSSVGLFTVSTEGQFIWRTYADTEEVEEMLLLKGLNKEGIETYIWDSHIIRRGIGG